MEHGQMGKESRTYLRVSFNDPLQFKICSAQFLSELHVASAQNISQSGLCFSSEKDPAVGTIIMIQTDLRTLSHCIKVENMLFELEGSILGKVVWTRVSRLRQDRFDVGVTFVKLEEAGQSEIREAIELLA